jgi:hypothetical protein
MDYYYSNYYTDNSDILAAEECTGRYCPLYYCCRDYLCCYYSYDYFSQETYWPMIQFMTIPCPIQKLFTGLKMLFIREV